MAATMLNVPVGTVIDYAGSSTPSGYLECDGGAVSRSAYPALFAAIGTAWGAGDGSSTFNLPDFRGRTAIGAGTGTAGGASAHALASYGGDERMQSHGHGLTGGVTSSGYVKGGVPSAGAHEHGIKYTSTGATGTAKAVMNSSSTTVTKAITSSNGAHTHDLPNHTHTHNLAVSSAGGRLPEHAALRDGQEAHPRGLGGLAAAHARGGWSHDGHEA